MNHESVNSNRSIAWSSLTKQFGEQIASPSQKDCMDALLEMTDDSEHLNIWLTIGFSDGTMAVLDFYPKGDIVLTEYGDIDMEDERSRVSSPSVRFGAHWMGACFSNMLDGQIDQVKEHILKARDLPEIKHKPQ